jgi:hypothetical protein
MKRRDGAFLAVAFLLGGTASCSSTSKLGPGGEGGTGTSGPRVVVSPATVSLSPGETQQFAAAVSGVDDASVTWSVEPSSGGGTIDASGLYTAPSAPGTYGIVATSVAKPSLRGTARAVVAPPSSIDPSAFLDADRATTWNPGLNAVGGIPVRTTVCANVPAGKSAAEIQAAIDGCPDEQVVQLAAGTYTLNGGEFILLNKPVTLRGAGPQATLLQKTDGAKPNHEETGPNPSPLIVVGPSQYPANEANESTDAVEDAAKGTFTVQVKDASHFQPGEVVLLDELSGAKFQTDPGGRGRILAAPDWRVVWQRHDPDQDTDDPVEVNGTTIGNGADAPSWFSRQDRPTSEMKQVAAVQGNTLTFSTPIHISYRTSHKAQVTRYGQDPHVHRAGVEDLGVKGGDNGNIRFQRAAESWARGIDSSVWHDEGFAIDESFRVEIRDFYVHDAAWAQPGGAGYAISFSGGSSEALIENGISVRANKVMVARCSGAGSVVAYNYVDMGYINTNGAWIEVGLNASHMVGPHHVLFEGNYGFNADSDKTHGNSIYHTFFRNYLRGLRAPFQNQADGSTVDDASQEGNGPRRAAGLGYYSYWMSFVGNVMGEPGKMDGWVYETSFGNGGPGIWMLGWDDWDPYPVDARVIETTLRHGNFDYVTNEVHWDPAVTEHTLPSSLYLTHPPAFFAAGKGYTWPWVDPAGDTKLHTLPAKARYDAGTPFTQP